jgi:hypothetical protein
MEAYNKKGLAVGSTTEKAPRHRPHLSMTMHLGYSL